MDTLHGKVIKEGYTFDNLMLVSAFSKVVPVKVVLSTQLSKKILLKIPVLSATMETVTRTSWRLLNKPRW